MKGPASQINACASAAIMCILTMQRIREALLVVERFLSTFLHEYKHMLALFICHSDTRHFCEHREKHSLAKVVEL